MDRLRIQDKFRISPTTQQGGTQTIQQSIYLTHNNPCGANTLIFQEMGLTGIRYIDLKNYLDAILGAEAMRALFDTVRVLGTEYIKNPDDPVFLRRYLNALDNWAHEGLASFPVPADYYEGYTIRFSVYDGAGCVIWDSSAPGLRITSVVGGNIIYTTVPLNANPFGSTTVRLFQLSNKYPVIPYLVGNAALFRSDFINNQTATPETEMATASLLIDSANTRTFGIPRYGFSARNNQNASGGIGYHCAHFINIRTTPDQDGKTTLIESIFARLSIEQNTL